MSRVLLSCVASVALLLVASTPTAAQHKPHAAAFTDTAHSSWTSREGAPADITALAQTADGYLWIGTPLGLHRFDGSRFTSFPISQADPGLPGRNITALTADPGGGLWIGDAHGGLSHLENRELSIIRLPSPFEKSSVDFLADFDQRLWVLTGNAIWTWNGHVWENFAATHGLPQDDYFTLFKDRTGNIWTSSRHHVYELRKGERQFREVKKEVFSITQFLQNDDGIMWVSDGWRSVRPLMADCAAKVIPLKGTAEIEFDRSGRLWIAQDAGGVIRVSGLEASCQRAPAVEKFDAKSGLTANVTQTLLKDRDGNFWVGTELGLDRFRPRAFLPVLEGGFQFYPALATAPDGTVWAEGHGMPLQHIIGDTITPIGSDFGSSPITVSDEGDVWLLDPWYHFLHKVLHGTGEDVRFPVPKIFVDTAAQHIAVAPSGAILVAFEGNGIWQFANGQWSVFRSPGLPADLPTALSVFDETTWVGYSDSSLFQISKAGHRLYGPSEGLQVGTVLALTKDEQGSLWVAGSEGVAFKVMSGFHTLQLSDPNVVQGTSGLTFDDGGNLWMNTGSGVARVAKHELELVRQDPNHRATATTFGAADGIVGTPAQIKPVPTMLKDGNGRLWIGEAGHIFAFMPTAIEQHQGVPQSAIQVVSVDGRAVPFGTKSARTLLLQSGRDNKLEIDYTGVDLTKSAEDRFRYKLEGFDREWQFAGRSRQAVYAGLRPGSYTFRVASTNDGQHWNELADGLRVKVLPAFYQTTWFALICAAVVVALLWLLYMLRIRYVTERIRDRLEQRTNERLRIARELHDTLLQSIHGLILRFHFATEQLQEPHPVRPMLKVALQRADALIIEGRKRVQNLRGEEVDAQPLVELLIDTARELQAEGTIPVRIEEEGIRRSLHAIVREEVCKIAHECLVNALQHSAATAIEVELIYGAFSFKFRCKDNGRGIDESVLKAGGRKGHWGLRGIKERAKQIGASVQIWSKPGHGTEIEIRIRALSAYASPRFLERLISRKSRY